MAEQRLYQTVAEKILEMIASGSYPPGTRLPGERELADRFQVSRVVIREAEISLEAIGHLEIGWAQASMSANRSLINSHTCPKQPRSNSRKRA